MDAQLHNIELMEKWLNLDSLTPDSHCNLFFVELRNE